jgi:hypothetical protein
MQAFAGKNMSNRLFLMTLRFFPIELIHLSTVAYSNRLLLFYVMSLMISCVSVLVKQRIALLFRSLKNIGLSTLSV